MKLLRCIFILLLLSAIFIIPSISVSQTKDPNKVYHVAILPFLINSQENLDYLREGIYDILSSRISVEGKIVVIDRSLVEQTLYEERPMRLDETVATKIGMRVGADYVVLGSLTKIGNYISLDARLLSITEEKPPLGVYTQHKGLEDVMVKIGDFAQEIGDKIVGSRVLAGQPPELKRPYLVQPRRERWKMGSEDLGFKKSQTFDLEIKGLDIGDVDGDGKNELVVMDNHSLYVFRSGAEKLSLIPPKVEAGYEYNFLTLDVADINRNGRAEIIVSALVGDYLRSFILEYEEGKFKKITENANWCFRVLEHPKDGPILIGQKMGTDGEVFGPIHKLVWKKNSFEKDSKMPFPKETKIFGLAMGDIRNKGTPELIGIDDSGRLRIIAKDRKSSWTGRERFGGTNNFYDNEAKKNLMNATKSTLGADYRVYIPGRILIKDLIGNGVNEVVVNKNISSTTNIVEKLRVFEKGEIHSLVWDGEVLTTNWKTKEINGYISDFQIKDVDNDGDEELVVAVIDLGSVLARKGVSYILFFKLF